MKQNTLNLLTANQDTLLTLEALRSFAYTWTDYTEIVEALRSTNSEFDHIWTTLHDQAKARYEKHGGMFIIEAQDILHVLLIKTSRKTLAELISTIKERLGPTFEKSMTMELKIAKARS